VIFPAFGLSTGAAAALDIVRVGGSITLAPMESLSGAEGIGHYDKTRRGYEEVRVAGAEAVPVKAAGFAAEDSGPLEDGQGPACCGVDRKEGAGAGQ